MLFHSSRPLLALCTRALPLGLGFTHPQTGYHCPCLPFSFCSVVAAVLVPKQALFCQEYYMAVTSGRYGSQEEEECGKRENCTVAV